MGRDLSKPIIPLRMYFMIHGTNFSGSDDDVKMDSLIRHNARPTWRVIFLIALLNMRTLYVYSIPQIFTFHFHFHPKQAHRLNTKQIRDRKSTAQKNPAIDCGPTVSTSSPPIGIHTKVARLAMK